MMPGADLPGLVQYLEDNSAELDAARLESGAAAERSEAAGVLPDPSVRIEWQDINQPGGVTLDPSRVGATKYSYLQPLPGWGKREAQQQIASAGARQMEAQQRAVRAELRSRMRLAFAQYYRAWNALQLNQELAGFAASASRLAQERYERGLVKQQDWLKAQLDEAALQSERFGLQAELQRTQARINALLNRPAGAALAPPQQLPELPPPARLEEAALQQRLADSSPQLLAQREQSAAAQANYELTQKNQRPDFIVAISPIQRGDSISSWDAMLEFTIPLQQNAHSAHRHEATQQLQASQARERALAQNLSADMSEHAAALRAASEQLQLIRSRTLPLAELNYQSALAGYQHGSMDYATLWQARRELQRNHVDELDALLAQQLHLAEIERLMGETP
ncbi:MAG TPA: TolC family protein [Steroidobacteraceae bacterium]|nr:TolC family protein [Steroidobacteraceae bacterium]